MKLSVITINWNNKNGLERTISSVLSQTYSDYEYIIIDGGSTDGSVDIISRNKDRISYWVSEPDSGVYNAMNKAIRVAQGEYLYFLNSGDYLDSDKVFENIFSEEIHDSFICGNFIWDRDGVLTKDNSYKSRSWLFSLYDIYSGFLNHQAFFIHKDMFEKYGLYDEKLKIMADWKLFLEAIGVHGESVKYRDVDISIYNTDGISSRIGGKAILKEKQQAAKEILPLEIYHKIDRLYYLQRNDFWIDFIHSKKWIHFLSKVFLKFCTVLKLTKI
ncbi:MAG: glycosyltransferase family 2 protein [Dysgonomonas sp.]|nr:glycosyltransferase family 2 protein [Dysgonomonas sp.]